jgi:hypothetical protein
MPCSTAETGRHGEPALIKKDFSALSAVKSASKLFYASRSTLIAFLSSAVLMTEVAVLPELVVA